MNTQETCNKDTAEKYTLKILWATTLQVFCRLYALKIVIETNIILNSKSTCKTKTTVYNLHIL